MFKDPLWLEIARKELGVQEIPGSTENHRILEYHSYTGLHAKSEEISWCAAFASFCMTQAGVINPHSAWAQDWADKDYFEFLEKPVHGCGCVYRWSAEHGHINFYDANSSLPFGCIGGNQADMDSGGEVTLADYSGKQGSVIAYIWPKGWPKPGEIGPSLPDVKPHPVTDSIKAITNIAAASAIAKYSWKQRGKAPIGYIKGLAVVFARNYLALLEGQSAQVAMAKARGLPEAVADQTDALSWYNSNFRALGMTNDISGPSTLRHLFVLLMGLGMRESSGKHCCGRDASASNTNSDTCEAGAWQTSFNARAAHPEMRKLFDYYRIRETEGLLDIFSEDVSCSTSNWKNYGSGEGFMFQALSKNCPEFAAEFAALGLRNIRRHWGPINRKEVEIKVDADQMFQEIQEYIDGHPAEFV